MNQKEFSEYFYSKCGTIYEEDCKYKTTHGFTKKYKRKCLRCNKNFSATFKHQRICGKCNCINNNLKLPRQDFVNHYAD